MVSIEPIKNIFCDQPVSFESNLLKAANMLKGKKQVRFQEPPRWLKAVRFTLGALFLAGSLAAQTPSQPLGYSIATPRPISPAEGSTTPSAQATQRQNPFLGSAPGALEKGAVSLTLQSSIERALRYNLGLIESTHATADVQAERLRALAALLPELTARGRQGYEAISFKEIGLKLPSIPGVAPFGPTTGGFGYQDARVALNQSVFDLHLRREYRFAKENEEASALSVKDSRDVVVLAAGTAYLQVAASASRVEAAKAQLASARELDQQTASRVKSEVSPEIDSLRAQVERQSAGQRLTNAESRLEKDRLTLARIIGLADGQPFTVDSSMTFHPLSGVTKDNAIAQAMLSRSDLASAAAAVQAAEATLRAQKAQRLPVVSVAADYGGGGANLSNLSQVYSISANVSVPLYVRAAASMPISARPNPASPAARPNTTTSKVASPTMSASPCSTPKLPNPA